MVAGRHRRRHRQLRAHGRGGDHASLQLRHDIAVEFLRYQATKAATGIEPVNKDAEEYVEDPEAELEEAEGKAEPAKKASAKKASPKK